jgi:hypothetical protein
MDKKILIYVQKGNKKKILLYSSEKDLMDLGGEFQIIENGFIPDISEISERWEVSKVTKNKNKMTVDYKLIFRKRE